MILGILTAMTSEHDQLASLLENRKTEQHGLFEYTLGTLADKQIVLRQCGIGKVNSALGAAELIKVFQPDCIISTGVAGGIDKCLDVMDVVVSSQIVYHDVWCGMGCDYGQVQGLPTFYQGEWSLVETALRLNEDEDNKTKIHAGLICTGDQFITNREELDKIKSHFPAGLAVDMESASIAQTCHIYKVPFVSFRIISDTPGATDDHASQWENFWAEIANRSFDVTKSFIESIRNI